MIKIALIGNPNIGKTTLFNALTGSNQKVGNWPGVTVDKKEGKITYKDKEIVLVDLPGTYSLGHFSEDEVIASKYILEGNPDLIIDLVDATNLERNLYLYSQIQEMDAKIVIGLNMMDEARAQGLNFDIKGLEEGLGVRVIPIVASKKEGLDQLLEACIQTYENNSFPKKLSYGHLDEKIEELAKVFENLSTGLPPYYLAIKYYEGDEETINKTRNLNGLKENALIQKIADDALKNKEANELDFIDKRYEYIHKIIVENTEVPKKTDLSFSDKLDSIITNKFFGLPIFAFVMFLVFQLTFAIGQDLLGSYIEDFLAVFKENVSSLLIAKNVPEFVSGFITDGLIDGVGTVLTFIPIIVVLFLLLGFLEDVGYMARVAYIMDFWMKKIGLQGKTIISMIVGFGCNVPGVMSTRTLENKNDRMIALLINPFMSCGAKIPVYSIFASAFFPESAALVTFSLYFIGFIVAIISAKIFSMTLFKNKATDFIMELPPYRPPIAINVLKNMWDNVYAFIKRATTTITLVLAVLYILANLPLGVAPYSEGSILGMIGGFLAPLLEPMGSNNWQAAVGLVAGMPAKEAVVATLGMVYAGVSDGPELLVSLQNHFTPLSAFAYLVFVLLYTPCVAVLGAVKKETGSIKWMLFMIFYTLLVAFIVSSLVFQVGRMFGFQ